MRVFVTGATGFIGSAVVQELLGAGHQVLGLARSDASAQVLTAAGAEVHRGSLDDLDSLREGAATSDGVVHLAYNHDFSQPGKALQTDLRATETFGTTLRNSDRPLVIASGLAGFAPRRIATERDLPYLAAYPRVASAQAALAFAPQGVRACVVRLAPSVHGEGDPNFVAALISVARERGVSGYIGDGQNRWPAVHRLDAARLFRLALEHAPAGSVLHGAAEEGVPLRAVAAVLGQQLGLPVVSVPGDKADEHFGWLTRFLVDVPASSTLTRERLGWQPTGPGLTEDLEQGHYFNS